MAWDPIGNNEYSGDAPLDAFGQALPDIAELWRTQHGRLPTTAELADALQEALGGFDADEVAARLAQFRDPFQTASPKKRQRARAGQVLAIPYAGSGRRAVYARVLYTPHKGDGGPGLGVCLAVLDRDVRGSDDWSDLGATPWLLGPFHPNDDLIRDASWPVLGEQPLTGPECELPCFARTVRRDQAWVSCIVDYFGNEIADNPAHRSRVIKASVGGGANVVPAIRALRGLGRWLPGYASYGGARG